MVPLTIRAVLLATAVASAAACQSLTEPPAAEPIASAIPVTSAEAPKAAPTTTASAKTPPTAATASAAPSNEKLGIVDVVVGRGETAKAGDTVSVHYVGTLTDGSEFDSSRKRGTSFDFPLGRGRVIKGWDDGVVGMKVGGRRKLTIPASLGYGARGAGPKIPPNSTLLFDIELLGIKAQ